MATDQTCIVVADGSHARLFGVEADGEWKLLSQLEYAAGRAKGEELITDNIDKSQTSRSPREIESERFARTIADVLDNWASKNVYDKLILVSPPKFLGTLRGCLTPQCEKRIVDVLAKDLTGVRTDELEARIPAFA